MESLIFVAMAVAWLVYLVPKGLKMHDESKLADAVENFSDDLRVVARRDAVTTEQTALTDSRPKRRVVSRPASVPTPETVGAEASTEPDTAAAEAAETASVAPARGRRAARALGRMFGWPVRLLRDRRAAARTRAPLTAAARRRRVLGSLLTLTAAATALAGFGVINWWSLTVPLVLVVGWLVACRLMVRNERSLRGGSARGGRSVAAPRSSRPARAPRRPRSTEETLVGSVAAVEAETAVAHETPYAGAADSSAPGSWDLAPMVLPTYVTKDAAERRAPQPFDLDSTGVWSSGRSDKDSQIARAAEQQAAEARQRTQAQAERKLGS